MFSVSDGVITITRGDYKTLEVQICDMQGRDYEMQEGDILTLSVRETPEESSPLLVQIHSATNILTFTPSDTSGVEPGQYSGDIQLTTADGKIATLWESVPAEQRNRGKVKNWKNFILLPEVTHNG